MELHRVVGRSDWEHIPPEEWNWWQRVAAQTNGWVTPANGVTIGGTGAFFVGLGEAVAHNWIAAGACITGARFCDWADGWIANKTGTKSVVGQALDAGLDKVQLLTAFAALSVTNLMPYEVSVPIVAEQVLVAGISYAGRQRGVNMQPGKAGKISVALGSATVIMDIGSRAAEVFAGVQQSEIASTALTALEYSPYAGMIGTVVVGGVASVGYARQAWGAVPAPEVETAPPTELL